MNLLYVYTEVTPNGHASFINLTYQTGALLNLGVDVLWLVPNGSKVESKEIRVKTYKNKLDMLRQLWSLAKSYDYVHTRVPWIALSMSVLHRGASLELHEANYLIHFLKLSRARIFVISDSLASRYSISDDKIIHDASVVTYSKVVPEKMTIGYVGSFKEGKGFKALEEIAKDFDNIRFCMWGNRHSRIANNVSYYGEYRHDQLISIFEKISILVHVPEERILGENGRNIALYTSPLKLFEYILSGRPMIILRNDNYLSILAKIPEDFIIDSRSELSTRIHAIIKNYSKYYSMAQQLSLELKHELSWEKRAEKILGKI
jgi:glycosyltransferase involved in cell wall biosynthesis